LLTLLQVSPQVRHLSSRIFGGKGAKLTALFNSFLSVIAITATLHTGQIELLSKIKITIISILPFNHKSEKCNQIMNNTLYIINAISIKLFFEVHIF